MHRCSPESRLVIISSLLVWGSCHVPQAAGWGAFFRGLLKLFFSEWRISSWHINGNIIAEPCFSCILRNKVFFFETLMLLIKITIISCRFPLWASSFRTLGWHHEGHCILLLAVVRPPFLRSSPSSDRLFLILQSTQKHNGRHVARTSGPAQTGMQRILVIMDKQTEDETPASRLLPLRGTGADMQSRLSDIALPLGSAGVYKDDTSVWPVLLTRKDIWTSPYIQLGASGWRRKST